LVNERDDAMKQNEGGNTPLSDMTLEELWQLFPIQLTAHQECWELWYQEEAQSLAKLLPGSALIHHIGSTVIKDIWAKPIVDILVEAEADRFADIKRKLLGNGYLCMAENEQRIDFNKGYTPDGFAKKVFHLHLRKFGDNNELYFRDYLNDHPEIAKEYEKLKLSLWKPFEHNRDGYTKGKTEFVQRITADAIRCYGRN